VWREAAVLILTYRENGQDYVILTKRTHDVPHHKGQIAFPGGAKNEADADLWTTALRETEEEIGLAASAITLVGELSPQLTPTGFRVTPYVAKIEVPEHWNINPREIAELFSVPLDHLRDPANLRLDTTTYQGIAYADPHFLYKDYIIWGMTGRVLFEWLDLA